MGSKGQKNKSKQNKPEVAPASSDGDIAKDKIDSKSADNKSITKKAETKKNANAISLKRIIQQTGNFLREAKSELQKVKWPAKKELISSTIVVIVLSLLVGGYLGLLDLAFIKIVTLIVG